MLKLFVGVAQSLLRSVNTRRILGCLRLFEVGFSRFMVLFFCIEGELGYFEIIFGLILKHLFTGMLDFPQKNVKLSIFKGL